MSGWFSHSGWFDAALREQLADRGVDLGVHLGEALEFGYDVVLIAGRLRGMGGEQQRQRLLERCFVLQKRFQQQYQ